MTIANKNILITPANGTSTLPNIVFTGVNNIPMTMSVADDNSLFWSNFTGQLFSIGNNVTTGSIFSVNDISGIPSISANANGSVCISPYGGNVGIGTCSPGYTLDITGNLRVTGNIIGTGSVASPGVFGTVYGVTCSTAATINTAIGYQALQYATAGCNTAMGYYAGNAISSGTQNTIIGACAMGNIAVGGCQNVAVGWQTMAGNLAVTGGCYNIAVGSYNLFCNGVGSCNITLGTCTMYNSVIGNNTIAIGTNAMVSSCCSSCNIAVGNFAMCQNNGCFNTVVGHLGLCSSTTSCYNTVVGYKAGTSISTGSYNVILGGYDGNTSTPAMGTANCYVILSSGSGCVGAYWCNGTGWIQANNATTWSQASDCRIKTNITNISCAVDLLTQLKPSCFEYKRTGISAVGFLAQEYQSVLPQQVTAVTNLGRDYLSLLDGDTSMLTIQEHLTPYLVRAIQEQQADIIALKARITALESR